MIKDIKILRKTEMKFLIFLRKNSKEKYMSQISKEVGVTYSNSQKNLKKMQEDGLIEASINENNKLNKYYFLTNKGKEVADNLIKIQKIMSK